jgi:hypothetical protein
MLNARSPRRCLVGLARIWHCRGIVYLQCRRFCILCVGFGGDKGNMQCYYTDELDSFAVEAVEGFVGSFNCFLL